MKTRISIPFKLSFIDYPTIDHCISVYFTGCWGTCRNCQNKELINNDYDIWTKNFTLIEFINTLYHESKRFKTNKVTLVGGDPLYDTNIEFTKQFLKQNTEYDVCLYTGESLDFVKSNGIKGWKYLKTGFYDESLYIDSIKTDKYFQLSSVNQNLYNEEGNLLSEKGKWIYKE
jgi:organic radical activating enzyme